MKFDSPGYSSFRKLPGYSSACSISGGIIRLCRIKIAVLMAGNESERFWEASCAGSYAAQERIDHMALFTPTIYKNRITDIKPADLQKLGVKGLLLDVDNTLTTHGSQYLDPAVEVWLQYMQQEGFALTVVSNSTHKRVRPFAGRIGLRFIAFACKPLPIGFWRACKRVGLSRKACAAVGDQVFTDIIGSHLAGVKSIQVMPIQLEEDKPFMMFKRRLEKKILERHKD